MPDRIETVRRWVMGIGGWTKALKSYGWTLGQGLLTVVFLQSHDPTVAVFWAMVIVAVANTLYQYARRYKIVKTD